MCYYVKVTFLSTLAANLSVNNIYFQIKSTVTVPSTIVNGQGQDVYTKTQFRCQSPMLSDLTLQHNLMKGHFWSYFIIISRSADISLTILFFASHCPSVQFLRVRFIGVKDLNLVSGCVQVHRTEFETSLGQFERSERL